MTNRRQPNHNQGLFERIPWKEAVIIGVVAFALVFALVAGLSEIEGALDDTEEDETAEIEDEPGYFTNQAWIFFSAHFVDLEASATTEFGDLDESFDILDELEELPAIAFYLAPIVTLVGSGYLLVRRNDHLIHSSTDGSLFGAAISAGYLPAVVFSIIIFDHQTDIEDIRVTYEIPFTDGTLIAGILFPLVFGAIGGYIAYSRLIKE